MIPPQTKYVIGMSGSVPNSLFSFDQNLSCGKYEFNCGELTIFESQVKGAIYYQGSGFSGV